MKKLTEEKVNVTEISKRLLEYDKALRHYIKGKFDEEQKREIKEMALKGNGFK